ncbi:UNVERIFIED_CONTAM: hypothetical protein FKN15_058294 [Acipenser sinensis]
MFSPLAEPDRQQQQQLCTALTYWFSALRRRTQNSMSVHRCPGSQSSLFMVF